MTRVGSAFSNIETTALTDLSDVLITSPADNDLLSYDSASTSWINQTPAGAGLDARYLQISNNLSDVGTVATARTNLGLGSGNSPAFTGLSLSGLTASELVATDASKNLVSLAVATYPSLTELTYVKGVTSAIQTQFTGKAATDQTMYIGTTQVAINRASAALTLAGITLTTPEIGVATGTSLDLGGTTLYASRAITVDTGGVLNIDIGSAAGDDFTVDTSKLVVEGDTGNVGIGNTAPEVALHVGTNTSAAVPGTGVVAQFERSVSGDTYINVTAIGGYRAGVLFGDGVNNVGSLIYNHDGDQFEFYTGPTRTLRLVYDPDSEDFQFQAATTISTSSTALKIIGGSSTTADLTLQTTSGVGATGADMHFLVGNAGGTEAMTILNSGLVGIGTTAPTALLHLKAGTATANTAPLKFTSGTLNTTAEAGAIEFLTDIFYATITTGAVRKPILLGNGVNFGPAAVASITVVDGQITAIS